ncbi:unnamed protein product [Protopolystoma xenopodis]|uniref:Uncharacterized protein n=1 Tax=Protopolystoma xenopodis TaxID=117903 RepID=A0A448X722_9PLAT|nr:unnamed protein product [Protopolystoma xenopodis]
MSETQQRAMEEAKRVRELLVSTKAVSSEYHSGEFLRKEIDVIRLADALFIQQGFPFEKEFLEKMQGQLSVHLEAAIGRDT